MTRKDYIAAAKIVCERKQNYPSNAGVIIEVAFAELFAADNPRFNRETFRAACVPKEVQETDWWI